MDGPLPVPTLPRRAAPSLRWPAALPALAAWAEAERGRFALWLPLLMAAGAVAYLTLRAEPPAWSGAAGCGLGVALLAAGWRGAPVRGAGAALLATSLGFASGQIAAWRAAPPLDPPNRAVIVTGVVRAVETLPKGRRVTLEQPTIATADSASEPLSRTLRLRLRDEDTVVVATGDRLRLHALLSRPSPPAYPGAWDLQRDAYFSGVGGYGFALGRADVLTHDPPSGLTRLLQRLRETIAGRIASALPAAEAAIATTLLTGDPSAVSAADKAAYRDSGLAHLLAIAGLHIGIVMGLVFGATRLLLACSERAALHWPLKAIAAAGALLAGGLYMLLTGAHVPIVRSFAMASLVTLAILSGRRGLSLRGLAVALAVIVLLAPNEVLGVSLQMSFSAVLALIAGYAALRPWLRRLRGEGGPARDFAVYVAGLAITSALAGTASAPFAAYHFGRIQLYFVLANMIAVPLTALWVMPLGLAALALMPLHLESVALLPMGWGVAAITAIGHAVAALPDAVLAVPPSPPWGIVLVAVGGAWLGLWRTRMRLAGAPVLLIGLLAPLLARPPDVLVSPDARLIGLRTAAGVWVEAGRGADRFTRDAWRQAWAADAVRDLPDAGGEPGAPDCDADACRWTGPGAASVLLARAPPSPADCTAALIVAAAPVRLRCPGGAVVIDRFSVWREGAHAVWLGPDGAVVRTDRAVRGERPWVPPPRHARVTAGLPTAPLDPPPPE